VADPYVNAIHVSLLREKELNPIYAEALANMRGGGLQARVLAERLLAAGPDALQPAERVFVMIDAESMAWLHREVWVRPPTQLAAWWRGAIQRVAR
jgi:membrane glycosyltransferase